LPELETQWSGSLHQTFCLMPEERRSKSLRIFLESDGAMRNEVLSKLPYDETRAKAKKGGTPDEKRYRDHRHVYQSVGLVYEKDGRLRVTDLGKATLRWLDLLTLKNRIILARHAAYALAACQLRNPTYAGEKYDPSVQVFPFAFIWRAMLALDGRISSDELNRAVFKVRNENDLAKAIANIATARAEGKPNAMGKEVLAGKRVNDRIVPYLSLASFGWTLFPYKREAESRDYYEIPREMLTLVKQAAKARYKHRDFGSAEEYVLHISNCAALPKDLR
jgi:hypothetical protein